MVKDSVLANPADFTPASASRPFGLRGPFLVDIAAELVGDSYRARIKSAVERLIDRGVFERQGVVIKLSRTA